MRARKTETLVRKQQIIEAALAVIGAEGVRNLNITGIAARVGIVPSALYRHFKGKDEVLDAILDFIGDRLLNNVRAVREESSSAPQRLQSLLMRHANLLSKNKAIPHVVFSDAMHAGHPARKEKLHGIITKYLKEIEKIIEEGVQEGSIHKDLNPETGSMLLLGSLMPAAILGIAVGYDIDILTHAENTWPILARCIVADKPGVKKSDSGKAHENT